MIARALCSLLLVAAVAEAYVDFGSSRIYDEYDFKGQASVVIDGLCAESCRIFASMTEDSRKMCNNLLIQMPKTFYSIGVIAESIDPATNQKIFLNVANTSKLTITNTNANYAAGPVVVYVVNNAGNDIHNPQPEVYEASVLHRKVSNLPLSVTVMSAVPFTLKQAPLEDDKPQGILAVMTGYDHMDSQRCPYLYYSNYDGPFPGFTMEVNGPIVSLMWDYYTHVYPPGALTATLGITNKRHLERSGWVSSPGYHGCPGLLPYRSSLYDYSSPFHAEITDEEPQEIIVDVLTNADEAHAVKVVDTDNGAAISDRPDVAATLTIPNTKNITLNWQPDGEGSYFLMRWHYIVDFPLK